MSFSKARIQRFNDCENDVPAPGTYDPKFDDKIKGLVIEKSDRFSDSKSVTSAECNLSVSSKRIGNITATFRTPQLPRKKTAGKSKIPGLKPKPEKLKYNSEEHLADLQVECTNKDKTIQEHERHIEDIKEEVRKLEKQLAELCTKQAEVEDQHKRDIETMAKLQQEVLNDHDEKHRVEMELLQLSLRDTHKELEEVNKKHIEVSQKYKKELNDLKKMYDEEKSEFTQQLEDARQTYLKEIENLTLARDRELAEVQEAAANRIQEETKRMKDHADKMVENAEAVTRETVAACRAECEERLKRVIVESDEKVNAMIRDARAAVEEEMRLTAERYKACLARVEIERAALDEKISQRDAEITRLSVTLEELKSSAETQESFGQSLQIELDRAETELVEKKEELRALKDQIRAEAAEMVARRKRFEVVMAENQASVAALTQRLAQNNAEVERLQNELKRGEDCLHEHRDLLSIMRNNSQMVHEQVHALMEQLDVKKGLVDQLESESLTEIQSMKSIFEAKIDDIKQIAAKEITKLKLECQTKTAQNTEMKNQLDEMADRLREVKSMLLQLEETNDAQELEISRIELLKMKLEDELAKQKLTMEENTSMLRTESEQYKIALDEANTKIKQLSDEVQQLKDKDHSLEEKSDILEIEKQKWKTFEKAILEELQDEKNRREAAELELKTRVEYNERLIKEYQEMSEKYAEVVGNHNHRQRIKHVSQLKDKIYQLEQELHARSRTIEQQRRTIEKLKLEEKQVHRKGKENVLGIPKNAHSTPVSSPHKQTTPLRSRNE